MIWDTLILILIMHITIVTPFRLGFGIVVGETEQGIEVRCENKGHDLKGSII